MSRPKLFLIIKDNSERVNKKNFQLIGGKPLHQFFIDKRKHFDIYIDTDSNEIIDFYSSKKYRSFVTPYKRKKEHIDAEYLGDISPAPLMIERFLQEHVSDNEVVITSHITSPFIEDSTILDALEKMNEFDSVSSVLSVKEYCVFGEGDSAKPINFNYDKIIKTQALRPVSVLNGAFFIIRKDIFENNGLKRISDKHYFFSVSGKEAIDIDNPIDLLIAQKIEEN